MSKLRVNIEGHSYEIEFDLPPNGSEFTVSVNGESLPVVLPRPKAAFDETDWLIVDGSPYEITFDRDLRWIKSFSGIQSLEVTDLETAVARPRSGDGRVKAPIPGLITHLLVNIGDAVEAGQPIAYLEAMKMQNEIRAPFDGTIAAIHVATQQTVKRGEVLIEIA